MKAKLVVISIVIYIVSSLVTFFVLSVNSPGSSIKSIFFFWDSSVFLDISRIFYPISNKLYTNKAYIPLPYDSWGLLFLGKGRVGDIEDGLPTSSADFLVSNIVVMINDTRNYTKFPLYDAYSGINYCFYRSSFNPSKSIMSIVSNSPSCGLVVCDKVNVYYYSASSDQFSYIESYTIHKEDKSSKLPKALPKKDILRESKNLIPTSDAPAENIGCFEISESEISKHPILDVTKTRTNYSFMPLYPSLIMFLTGFGRFPIDMTSLGLLLSLVFYIFCVYIVYKFYSYRFSVEYGKLYAYLFMLFPLTFYLWTFNSLGLFILLLFSSFYTASVGRLKVSIILFTACIYTDFYALFFLLPYLALFRKNLDKLLVFSFSLSALVPWILYLKNITGSYLTLYLSKLPWYSPAITPLGSFYFSFLSKDTVLVTINVLFSVIIFGLFVLGMFRKYNKMYHLIILSFLLASLYNGGFQGMLKYSLVFFLLPLYMNNEGMFKNLIIKYLVFVVFLVCQVFLFIFWRSGFSFIY